VQAIEAGFFQDEIAEAAYVISQGIEDGPPVLVGVNRFADDAAVERALKDVEAAGGGTDNLLYPMKDALRTRATLGEVSDTPRSVFGEYRPSR
jgi:methylmalonyl-CoA mutase N-terminal domain/subunit